MKQKEKGSDKMIKYNIKFIAPDYDKKQKTTITNIRMINEDDINMLFKERANNRHKMQSGYSVYLDKGVMKTAFLTAKVRTKKEMFTDDIIGSKYCCPYVPLIIEAEGKVNLPKHCVINATNLSFYVLDTKDVAKDGKLIRKTKMILNNWQPEVTLCGKHQSFFGHSGASTLSGISLHIKETIAFMMLATADQTV